MSTEQRGPGPDGRRGSVLLGLAIAIVPLVLSLLLLLALVFVDLGGTPFPLGGVTFVLASGVLLVVGLVLAARRRTRRTGVGILTGLVATVATVLGLGYTALIQFKEHF